MLFLLFLSNFNYYIYGVAYMQLSPVAEILLWDMLNPSSSTLILIVWERYYLYYKWFSKRLKLGKHTRNQKDRPPAIQNSLTFLFTSKDALYALRY